MIPLTIEEIKSYHEQNICYNGKKEFTTNSLTIIKSKIISIILELLIIFVIEDTKHQKKFL